MASRAIENIWMAIVRNSLAKMRIKMEFWVLYLLGEDPGRPSGSVSEINTHQSPTRSVRHMVINGLQQVERKTIEVAEKFIQRYSGEIQDQLEVAGLQNMEEAFRGIQDQLEVAGLQYMEEACRGAQDQVEAVEPRASRGQGRTRAARQIAPQPRRRSVRLAAQRAAGK
jgi:hypothetical protein